MGGGRCSVVGTYARFVRRLHEYVAVVGVENVPMPNQENVPMPSQRVDGGNDAERIGRDGNARSRRAS